MKHFLCTLFLLSVTALLLPSQTQAQTQYSTPPEAFITYQKAIVDAERMLKNDSALQAYGKFRFAFSNYSKVNPSHYYHAGLCALKIKEESRALEYFEKAVTEGYEIDSVRQSKIVFNNKNTRDEFKRNFKVWDAKRQANINTLFQTTIIQLADGAKKYNTPTYKTATEYCLTCMKTKGCSKTAPEYISKYKLVKEKMKADSVTAATLITNIRQFGFPDMKLVGKVAAENARTILLNYDSDAKNGRSDGMLFNAMLEGKISPKFYAQIVDRRNAMAGLTPEFYEPITGYEKTVKADLKSVNNRRSKIGLHDVILPGKPAPNGPKAKDGSLLPVAAPTYYEY